MKAILIICLMLTASILLSYDVTYTVIQNGMGDFETVKQAVEAVQNGQTAKIYVFGPDVYSGPNNRRINWDGTQKTIHIQGINNPVINCQGTGRAFHIVNGTAGDIIRDLKIINGYDDGTINLQYNGAGIRISGGNPQLIGNTIENSHAANIKMGGGIYAENCNGAEIIGNTFNSNIGFSGGAIYLNSCSEIIIEENTFYNNSSSIYSGSGTSSAGSSGAIHVNGGASNRIIDNIFQGNKSYHGGAAITFEETSDVLLCENRFIGNVWGPLAQLGVHNPSIVLFYDCPAEHVISYNLFQENHNAIESGSYSVLCFQTSYSENPVEFLVHNNSFIQNYVIDDFGSLINAYYSGSHTMSVIIRNSLFFMNDMPAIEACPGNEHISFLIDYSLTYQNELIDTGNPPANFTICYETSLINEYPYFDETFQPIWDSTIVSPLIDSGYPGIVDPDGSPSDIGAIRAVWHDYHLTRVQSYRYRWLSFPVIDRLFFEEGEDALYILAPIEEQTEEFTLHTLCRVIDEEKWNKWEIPINENFPVWTVTDIPVLDSRVGYKLHSPDDLEIPTSGFKMSDNTLIELHEGENWVGYFLKETLSVRRALDDIWDYIEAVYSEDWAYTPGDPNFPAERSAMIYGKMYKIFVDRDCSFVYGGGTPIPPKHREMTEGFAYSETPMYSVVTIDELNDPEALEIGMFLDNECIGGTVLDGDPVQILAFPPDNDLNGVVHFELYYGSRSSNRIIRDFVLYEPQNESNRGTVLDLRPYEFYYVSLEKSDPEVRGFSLNNYPNPFNPETVITYNLPDNSRVELIIYNLKGQRVKKLVNEEQSAGIKTIIWDGRDERGNRVSSGIYFYRIKAGELTEQKKMILLK